ncbi:MAG TPA: hypothetical protein VLK30_11370 [Candidatus Limnocylindrales bacterium]|nr:hypothetical protein [Candidatus Limnocylindrales bacterium]
MAAAALLILLSGCGGDAAPVASPSPSEPSATFTPFVPATPQRPQRQEPSLPAAIEETAAAAAGGSLYVMGGFDAVGNSLDSTYVFDGKTWRSGPRLPLPLDHPSAASLDGRVYIAGGHSNGRDSNLVYRLDGDHWTKVASMQFPRGGHTLIAAEGRLIAAGGNTNSGNVAAVESYDPATDSWSVQPSLPGPRNHVMGFVTGAAICVAGGRSPTTARVDCIGVGQQTWSRLADLPQASSGGGAATFIGGDVVVMGGQDASETRIVAQLTRYSPGHGWTSGESMLDPRHGFELAIYEGRAWACGGGSAPGLHPVSTCTSIGDTGPAHSR